MQLAQFFNQARMYLADPRFQGAEIDYKMTLQAELRPAMDAYQTGETDAIDHLTRALRSPNQNIINWRVIQPFAQWCQGNPGESQRALRSLWHGRGDVESRVRRFSNDLATGAAIKQPGSQLAVASTLLMGLSAENHPPVRTAVLKAAFSETGYPTFARSQDAAARYKHALDFFDMLVDRASEFNAHLQSRLEAQGVTWCVTGGWESNPPAVEPSGEDGADPAETLRLIAAAANGGVVAATEREALVRSRRGQGRFRSGLIGLWGRCAVTGCRNLRLLKASHLKPWNASSNPERLNPFNGLLLTPHLDAALDCGLITFTTEGDLLPSEALSAADRRAIGLSRGMRLARVFRENLPFLRYHRKHQFRS